MDAHTRAILTQFGTSAYAQAILNKDAQHLIYMAKKYNVAVPSTKEVNEAVKAIIAEQFKK
ncbi:hypothetical protein [Aeromonas dhakensis]|uniref:hypothetical protein n=1 Tax=Aeromonas dhakensis TaxID=196024 RepID=UPI0038CF4EAD